MLLEFPFHSWENNTNWEKEILISVLGFAFLRKNRRKEFCVKTVTVSVLTIITVISRALVIQNQWKNKKFQFFFSDTQSANSRIFIYQWKWRHELNQKVWGLVNRTWRLIWRKKFKSSGSILQRINILRQNFAEERDCEIRVVVLWSTSYFGVFSAEKLLIGVKWNFHFRTLRKTLMCRKTVKDEKFQSLRRKQKNSLFIIKIKIVWSLLISIMSLFC